MSHSNLTMPASSRLPSQHLIGPVPSSPGAWSQLASTSAMHTARATRSSARTQNARGILLPIRTKNNADCVRPYPAISNGILRRASPVYADFPSYLFSCARRACSLLSRPTFLRKAQPDDASIEASPRARLQADIRLLLWTESRPASSTSQGEDKHPR